MTASEIEIRFDRVGAVFYQGETVSGIVLVQGGCSHSGISLHVEGTISVLVHPKSNAPFDTVGQHIQPVSMIDLTVPLAEAGKLPDGIVEISFAFELKSTSPHIRMQETYQGVYINSTYSATGVIVKGGALGGGKKLSKPAVMNIMCPGQAMPTQSNALSSDQGVYFSVSPSTLRSAKKYHGDKVPHFVIEGFLDHFYNDIDIPLSGWIKIKECEFIVTSVEIQLVRVEYCATNVENVAREATEIQNIQIGEGDVMRGVEIPIYMMFPKWYTCPCLKTKHIKLEFEVNMVITSLDKNQVTQNLPIKLFRSRS